MQRLFCATIASAVGGGLLALLTAPSAVAARPLTGCVGSDFVSLGGSGQSGIGSCGVGLRMVVVGSDGTCEPGGGGGSCQGTPCESDLLIYYRSSCTSTVVYSYSFEGEDPLAGGGDTIGSLPAVLYWALVTDAISIDLPDGMTLECTGSIQAGSDVANASASAMCTSCLSGTGPQ